MATTLDELIGQSEPYRHFSNRPKADSDPAGINRSTSSGGWSDNEVPDEHHPSPQRLPPPASEHGLPAAQEASDRHAALEDSIAQWAASVETRSFGPTYAEPATDLGDWAVHGVPEQSDHRAHQAVQDEHPWYHYQDSGLQIPDTAQGLPQTA
ncbi:hypothetical protein MAPG_01241 [Magnaporthiopsis poae ATCC 64411]|uniref:Uncharacterized protein n=1 Tax=Magnaporthiopsis poae (strain ATCC 64411 / 73-15) TaxID=644358 RepID=A0A0C4DN63_MAGP6|nr:hypothetical protein MAPG_01241 [Magnaporthiopsis poae ATCC 64411]